MSSTVCVTDMSVIPFPTFEPALPHTSNTAASPLPHIPCRSTRASPLFSLSDTSLSDSSTPPSSDGAIYPLQSRSAAFMRHDSESSSSSSAPSDDIRPTIISRARRLTSQHSTTIDPRDIFTPTVPASAPVKPSADASFADLEGRKQTPLRDPSDDEDTHPFPVLKRSSVCKVGKLRLEGSIGKEARRTPDPLVTSPSPPAVSTPIVKQQQQPQTVRKKSGQPVKSSLKSARRPELHVVTDGPFAKSEPATPSHAKAVHFDSKLEHVKLFLAEQKPLAVSRDGSPTSDTSGDEFPSFIYGSGTREERQVKMLVPNMPSSPSKDDNVALQELALSQDQRAITGTVRVRNIAYEKWLAARFTLDWWQTTSEVTARYEKSTEGGSFDMFSFTIRLCDIWSRIEEKTILMALRYTVAGQEYWDNNAGRNYHIKFVLARPSEPSSAVDNETSLKDLNSRLEDVAKARSASSPYRLGRSFSADHQYSSFLKPSSSRYDFAQAYKVPWVRNAAPQPSRHTRTQTYPSAPATAAPAVAPWSTASKATGHITPPRPKPPPISLEPLQEVMDDMPTPPTSSETKPALLDSPSPTRERNHRRGYIDEVMEGSPSLRRTPVGSPLRFDVTNKDAAVHLPRTRSYPFSATRNAPQQSALKPPLSIQTTSVAEVGSEASTPYESSQTSSSSDSTSSSTPPLFSPVSDGHGSDTNYKQFLDQFCFYTGSDPLLHESSETLPRSHSTSSIERFFLSHSPSQSFSSHVHDRFPFESGGTATPTILSV